MWKSFLALDLEGLKFPPESPECFQWNRVFSAGRGIFIMETVVLDDFGAVKVGKSSGVQMEFSLRSQWFY